MEQCNRPVYGTAAAVLILGTIAAAVWAAGTAAAGYVMWAGFGILGCAVTVIAARHRARRQQATGACLTCDRPCPQVTRQLPDEPVTIVIGPRPARVAAPPPVPALPAGAGPRVTQAAPWRFRTRPAVPRERVPS